jgi:hypothetical protein
LIDISFTNKNQEYIHSSKLIDSAEALEVKAETVFIPEPPQAIILSTALLDSPASMNRQQGTVLLTKEHSQNQKFDKTQGVIAIR